MGYAFISYSSIQQQQLAQVKEYLKTNGISFWSAPDDIPIGSKYSEVIKRAIADSSCVIFLLSERSQDSTYCKLEIALALKLEKPIIPIQLEDLILNDDFSLYLSTSEIFPLPGKITTNKTHKLLSQLKLLCTDPDQPPAEPVDPSYKVGWFRKGTWLQIFGWIWLVGGAIPVSVFAEICYPSPSYYGGNHPVDYWNGPLIEEMGFKRSILVTFLLLVGLLMICYGFSLNRKKRGTTRLYFKQFSLCQVLLLISWISFGLSFFLFTLIIEHYYSALTYISSVVWPLSLLLYLVTLIVWLFGRIRQFCRWCKSKIK